MGLQMKRIPCPYKEISCGQSNPWQSDAGGGTGISLFVFLCVILLIPMRMMDRQRQIQAAVETVGEEISQYAYSAWLLGKEREGRWMRAGMSWPQMV